MDVFNHNWTEKMKTNPVANFILNNYDLEDEVTKDPGFIRYNLWRQRLVKTDRKNKRNQYIYDTEYDKENVGVFYSKKEHKKLRKFPRLDKTKPRDRKYDTWYVKSKGRNVVKPSDIILPNYSENHYWANSRPNSLYNLHYPSIR